MYIVLWATAGAGCSFGCISIRGVGVARARSGCSQSQVQRHDHAGACADTECEDDIGQLWSRAQELGVAQGGPGKLGQLEQEQVAPDLLEDGEHGDFVEHGAQQEGEEGGLGLAEVQRAHGAVVDVSQQELVDGDVPDSAELLEGDAVPPVTVEVPVCEPGEFCDAVQQGVPDHVEGEHVQDTEARDHLEEQEEPLLDGGDPAAEGGRVVVLDAAHGDRVHEDLRSDHHEEDGAHDGAELLEDVSPPDVRGARVVDLVHEHGEHAEHEVVAAADVVGEVVVLGLVVEFEKTEIAAFLQDVFGLGGQGLFELVQFVGGELQLVLDVPEIAVVEGERVGFHEQHDRVQEQEDPGDPAEMEVVHVHGEGHGDEAQLEEADGDEPGPLPPDEPELDQPVHEHDEESGQEQRQVEQRDGEQVGRHVLHDLHAGEPAFVRHVVVHAAAEGDPAHEHPCEHVDAREVRLQFLAWGCSGSGGSGGGGGGGSGDLALLGLLQALELLLQDGALERGLEGHVDGAVQERGPRVEAHVPEERHVLAGVLAVDPGARLALEVREVLLHAGVHRILLLRLLVLLVVPVLALLLLLLLSGRSRCCHGHARGRGRRWFFQRRGGRPWRHFHGLLW